MTDETYWRGLFNTMLLKAAVLSDDRRHRFWLTRIWDRGKPVLVIVMFNPSKADANKDDMTIGRCCHFAKLWGYGGILVINLHSFRTSMPNDLRAAQRTGVVTNEAANLVAWKVALETPRDNGLPVLIAWGAMANEDDRKPYRELLSGLELVCLGVNDKNQPKHPMARGKHRVPDDQQPIPMRLAA